MFEQHQGTHILQSLDGFAFVLAADGRFLYISETVSIYLGLSQVEMTGSTIFDYVHQHDHAEVSEQLGLNAGHSPPPPSTANSDDGSCDRPGKRLLCNHPYMSMHVYTTNNFSCNYLYNLSRYSIDFVCIRLFDLAPYERLNSKI